MRVSQKSNFLLDILKQVTSGAVGLPVFQREYIWTKSDVEDLMKSIMRGWPIGSFTLWKPLSEDLVETHGKGRLGPVETSADCEFLLLDGQNRLSSIMYAAFLDNVRPIASGDAVWNPDHQLSQGELDTWFDGEVLTVDLLDRSIHFGPDEYAWGAHSVPLGDVLNAFVLRRTSTRAFFDKADSHAWPDSYLTFCGDTLTARFMESRVTTTELLDATLDEALECYLTICKAGQPISPDDFKSAVRFRENAAIGLRHK